MSESDSGKTHAGKNKPPAKSGANRQPAGPASDGLVTAAGAAGAYRRLAGRGPLTPDDVLQLQRVAGNQTVIRHGIAGSGPAAIQRRLPRVTTPTVQPVANIPPETLAALRQRVEAYRTTPGSETGQAAVQAALAWLESSGAVQYSGQPDITSSSPNFRTRPSMAADGLLRQEGTNPASLSGYTFPYPGRTPPQIAVEIYGRAFIGDDVDNSLGYLLGTISHEYIHIQQIREQLQHPGRADSSEAEDEVQAWLWQAENAANLGIQPGTSGASQVVGNLRAYFGQCPPATQRSLRQRVDQAVAALQPPH